MLSIYVIIYAPPLDQPLISILSKLTLVTNQLQKGSPGPPPMTSSVNFYVYWTKTIFFLLLELFHLLQSCCYFSNLHVHPPDPAQHRHVSRWHSSHLHDNLHWQLQITAAMNFLHAFWCWIFFSQQILSSKKIQEHAMSMEHTLGF